jgi:hypothetical protein
MAMSRLLALGGALGLSIALGLLVRPVLAVTSGAPVSDPAPKDDHVVVTFRPNVGDYFPRVVDLVLGLKAAEPMRMKDTWRFPVGERGTQNDYATFFASLPYVAQVSPSPSQHEDSAPSSSYIPGELLVKFKAGVTQDQIDAFNAQYGVTIKGHITGIGVYQLQLPPDRSVEEMERIYKASGLVEYAEPNRRISIPRLPGMRPFRPGFPGSTATGSVKVRFVSGAIPDLVALVYGMRPLGPAADGVLHLAPNLKTSPDTAARILRLCPSVQSAQVSS